nr:RNA-dependent RNA polymerase [Hippocampus erectus astro-like virus 1]
MLEKFDYSTPTKLEPYCYQLALDTVRSEYSYMDGAKKVDLLFTEKNVDSTPGYPKKQKYQTEKDLLEDQGLSSYFRQLKELEESGYAYEPLWYAFPKYEIIKKTKIQTNDIRMIMCTDPVFTRVGAMFDQVQNQRMKKMTQTKEAQVGWVPFRGGLQDRLNRLFEGKNKLMEVDWTRFDGTIPAFLMRDIRQIRKEYLDLQPEDEVLLDWYNTHLIEKWCLLPNEDVVFITNGNPSGQISTSSDNCMVNTCLVAYETSCWALEKGVALTKEELTSIYSSICYGDDRLSAYVAEKTFVRGEDAITITFPPPPEFVIKLYADHFGMWVKPENCKVHDTLVGATFCGMTFVEDNGHLVGAYNHEKVVTSIMQPKNALECPVEYLCKLYSIAACVCYSKPEYRDYVFRLMGSVKQWLRDQRIPFPDLTRRDIKNLWIRPQKDESGALPNLQTTDSKQTHHQSEDTPVGQGPLHSAIPDDKMSGTGAPVSDKWYKCDHCGKNVQCIHREQHSTKCGGTGAKPKAPNPNTTSRRKPRRKPPPTNNPEMNRALMEQRMSQKWIKANLEHCSPVHVERNRGALGDDQGRVLTWTDRKTFTFLSTGTDITVVALPYANAPFAAWATAETKLTGEEKPQTEESTEESKTPVNTIFGVVGTSTGDLNLMGYMPGPEGATAWRVAGSSITIRTTDGSGTLETCSLNEGNVRLNDMSDKPHHYRGLVEDGCYVVTRTTAYGAFQSGQPRKRSFKFHPKTDDYRYVDLECGSKMEFVLHDGTTNQVDSNIGGETKRKPMVIHLNNVGKGTTVEFLVVHHRDFKVPPDNQHARYTVDSRVSLGDNETAITRFDAIRPVTYPARFNTTGAILGWFGKALTVLGSVLAVFFPIGGIVAGAAGAAFSFAASKVD